MITELKPVRDFWKKMPSERHARIFLEAMIWPSGRHCPHCGSLSSTSIRGRSARPGLYQCGERECRLQFKVTTKTPMHAAKLDLRIWIAAIFLVLTSSKGISPVVMARILGVNQKTAWKLGHAIRELMDDREAVSARLAGVAEVDEAYVGRAPRFKKGVKNKRGRGTGKPMVLVAADRNGQAKATLVPNAQGATLGPIMKEWIDPSSALMTDSNTAYRKIGRSFASHHTVTHGKRQYSQPSKRAHINTVEAVNSQAQRALNGVYHRLGRQHLKRYPDEILWRWNHRQQEVKVRNQKTSSGTKKIATTVWKLIPVVEQMRGMLCCAVGRQIRRTPSWGLHWP
ncbi:Transposase [Phaeobacter porticola]|uniref:Transposase n=2 Tax=Phaeobacter porticola TaxID=1844006 RepID=A0A1L3I2V0_9RHOB|nr:Transposase [Phaeobacter porticola]